MPNMLTVVLVSIILIVICMGVHSDMKVKVAVVGFQKNELEMLDFWCEYHTSLFGASNVAVLDNYSTDPKTLEILAKWAKEGMTVVYNQGPYDRKGQLLTTAFQTHFTYHGIALPLDIDEVVVSYRDNVPVVNRTIIHSDFDLFIAQGKPCGASTQFFTNQPLTAQENLTTTAYFLPDHAGEWYAKKYMRMEVLAGLDNGNHHAKMKYRFNHNHCQFDINHIGLLHYLNADPTLKLRKAITDGIGFNILPKNMTAENLSQFGAVIDSLRNATILEGAHKIARVIQAFDKGVDSLYTPVDKDKLVRVGNFAEMLAMIKKE